MTVVERIQAITRNGMYLSKVTPYGKINRDTRAKSIRISRKYGRKPLGSN